MSGHSPARLLAAIAVIGCLLVGCTAPSPEAGEATTPPTVAGASATPTETALERQQREDFEEAEAQYRRFMAEYDRLALAGGATKPSTVMRETATGKYLQVYISLLKEQKANDYKYTHATLIGRVQPGAYSRNQLTLEVCEDGSKNRVLDEKGKQVDRGRVLLRSLYVRPVDGRWKLWNGDEQGSAISCE